MPSCHGNGETEAQRHPCKAADGDAQCGPSTEILWPLRVPSNLRFSMIPVGMQARDGDGDRCFTGCLYPPNP